MKPEDDTLAQFQDALKNIDAQKRARQIIQTHWKQHLQKGHILQSEAATVETETLNKEIVSQLKSVDLLLQETSLDNEDMDESNCKTHRGSSKFSSKNFGDEDVKVINDSICELKKDVSCSDEQIKNSKYVFSSGQILQDPEALAAVKTNVNEEVKVTALRRALDNIKNCEENEVRKLRKNIEREDSSKIKKKKREKRKKLKKDKMKQAEKALKILLKKKILTEEDLQRYLKEDDCKRDRKEINFDRHIHEDDSQEEIKRICKLKGDCDFEDVTMRSGDKV